jgi:hypothetical protein
VNSLKSAKPSGIIDSQLHYLLGKFEDPCTL